MTLIRRFPEPAHRPPVVLIGSDSLKKRDPRSVLTVLGIIIAVTSTITVVSVVQGFGNYVTDFLQGMGTNTMWVVPRRPAGADRMGMGRVSMTMADLNAVIEQCNKLNRVSPVIIANSPIEYGREVTVDTQVFGVGAHFQAIRNFYVDVGRSFSPVGIERAAQVCCLGRDVMEQLQCDESVVGEYVLLGGQRFRVIGLIE